MTAHVMPEDIEHCLVAGMDDHLAKPMTLDGLRRVVERWAVPTEEEDANG